MEYDNIVEDETEINYSYTAGEYSPSPQQHHHHVPLRSSNSAPNWNSHANRNNNNNNMPSPLDNSDGWRIVEEETSRSRPQSYLDSPLPIVFTLLVAVVCQYHGRILRWYRDRVQWIRADADIEHVSGFRLAWDILLSIVVSVVDYIRALYQMSIEILRCCFDWIFAFCGIRTSLLSSSSSGDYYSQPNNLHSSSKMHQSRLLYGRGSQQRQTTSTGYYSRQRCNSLPDLDDGTATTSAAGAGVAGCVVEPSFADTQNAMDFFLNNDNKQTEIEETTAQPLNTAGASTMCNKAGNPQRQRILQQQPPEVEEWDWGRMLRAELEPAFLHDQDYPRDWMVYHPVLGLVQKTQADMFDRGEFPAATHDEETDAIVEPLPIESGDDESSRISGNLPLSTNTDSLQPQNGTTASHFHEEEKKDDVVGIVSSSDVVDTDVSLEHPNNSSQRQQQQKPDEQPSHHSTSEEVDCGRGAESNQTSSNPETSSSSSSSAVTNGGALPVLRSVVATT